MNNLNIKICTLFVFLLLLTTSVYAISASIGNARMILYPEVTPGKPTTIEKTILVKNINDIAVEINLEAFGDLVPITEIIDSNFILGPDEEKNARFKLTIDKPGRYEGNIGVSFKPADSSSDQGVGLVSNIIVITKEAAEGSDTNQPNTQDELKEKNTGLFVGLGVIAVILFVGLAIYFLIKKANKPKRKRRK